MSTTQTSLAVKPPVWETKCSMDYADIPVLDFNDWTRPGGKEKLVAQVKDTVEKTGFFYLINFGFSEAEINAQWEIGRQVLDLPTEEKMKYRAALEAGDYNGYRPLGSIEQLPGPRDNWECYHVFKPSIGTLHTEIAYKVLRLIALVLEMPEDTMVDQHRYEDPSSAFLRYMKYHPHAPEVNREYKQIYTRGHTDFGSITFPFSQPVGGLELQTREGDWKAVRHIPNSIVVNTADMMHFCTKGYLHGCMHRVVAPPADQEHMERFGLICFLRPSDKAVLQMADSPMLKRDGYAQRADSKELEPLRSVTVGEWVKIQTRKNSVPFDQQPLDQREVQTVS